MSVNDSGDKRERERKGVACVLVSNSVFLPLLCIFSFLKKAKVLGLYFCV